ncbi:glycosyltransferase family 9 protein [Flavivirga amylovorans]|uniref:Glycosyltransferase family 9 protein n=1 Tax=Flavivirga amylovorans TaxID=870486 RepID=A0ABT8X635_9FLAO|nr:glycosyltransferase family 9 protein [Flavivirga amylovorans]MDO5989292.1 glycosyltransferase family 9 protein [Flavivirga amylovorans]
MPKHPKHILVIRLSAMGDVAMIVPVLQALNRQYPKVKITVLTRAFFTPFFRDLKNVTVFPADVKGKHKGIWGLFKLSKVLKKLEIDVVADLHNVLRSNILKFFFLGTPFSQIDKGRAEKKALVSGKIFQQLKTTHQRYADVFEGLGFKLNLSNPKFPKKAILKKEVQELLKPDSKRMIGIAPFAAHEAKMYPLNLMKEVIAELSKKYTVVLFGGGKKEIAILNDFEKSLDHVISVAGKLSLNEELDVISNLDAMLSMDSGNAHIAAMLGVKVVTIWGVTHPFAGFTPFNQPESYTLLSDKNQFPEIPTSIYGNKYPESYKEASRSISPKKIIEKIAEIV